MLTSVYCIPAAFQANLRQSYRGSISVAAQCIDTQLMSYESLGKYLQIKVCHLYVR